MRSRGLSAALCLLFMLMVGPAAFGQPPTEEPHADEEARSLFEAGRSAMSAGRYEDALDYFRKAYELSGRPQLLFNIGVAAERLRLDAEALDAYERYLEVSPDDGGRADVERRIAILKSSLEKQPPPEEVAGEEPPPSPDTASAHTPAATDTARRKRPFTWVALGASAAFGLSAGMFWWKANQEHDELAKECAAFGCTREDVDDSSGPTFVTLTNVMLGLTGAAAITTVVLFFVEGRNGGSDREVRVGLGPGSLRLEGRF